MKLLASCKAITWQCEGQARCPSVEHSKQGVKHGLGRCTPLTQEGLAPEPHQASSESSAAMHSTLSTVSGQHVLRQHY